MERATVGIFCMAILVGFLIFGTPRSEPMTKSNLVSGSDAIVVGYVSNVVCKKMGSCQGYELAFSPESTFKGSVSGPTQVFIGAT